MKIVFNEINEFEKNMISYWEKFETENSERKKNYYMNGEKGRIHCLQIMVLLIKILKKNKWKKLKKENLKKKFIELKQKRISFGYNIKNKL